jgi:amyloid beta precursor protein binding protein 1
MLGCDANHKQDKSFAELFESQKYTLIVYTLPIKADNLAIIHEYTNTNKLPALAIHSAGFYSYFKTHLPGSFPIVDTHPDTSTTTDLRLLDPWPELLEFAAELTRDLENQSALEHGHIPYIAILVHYLIKWKEDHGSAPSTYKDKTLFRSKVAAGTRTDNAEGGEENFEEAVGAVLKTVSSPSLSSSVREVFDYKPDEASTIFHRLCEPLI